jgi:hypothetical protein
MADYADALLRGAANDEDPFTDKFFKQRSKLYRAMRVDLGTSFLQPSLERLLP